MSFGCSYTPFPEPAMQYLPDIISITLPPVDLTEQQFTEIHTAQDEE
jgi:hypothetical protein